MPGLIFKKNVQPFRNKGDKKKFHSESRAQRMLDDCLIHNQPVGCQVGVYYLTYFLRNIDFHLMLTTLLVMERQMTGI